MIIFLLQIIKNRADQKHVPFLTPEPTIPFCKMNNDWTDPPNWGTLKDKDAGGLGLRFCTLFRPMLTDNGLCFSMNSYDQSKKLFKPSVYMNTLSKVFSASYVSEHAIRNNILLDGLFYPRGIGSKNGLKLTLDAHTVTPGNYKVICDFHA